MKISELKIGQKALIMIILLMVVVGSSITVGIIMLSKSSKDTVLASISEKFVDIQEISVAEFNSAEKVARDGIAEASGIGSLDTISTIVLTSQKEFSQVVQNETGEVSTNINSILETQNKNTNTALEEALKLASKSISEIMAFDNHSLNILANEAIFDLDSQNTASIESLNRFATNLSMMKEKLWTMEDENSTDIDSLLIELIVNFDDPAYSHEQALDFLITELDALKDKVASRKEVFYKDVLDDFMLQEKVVEEEFRLVRGKAHYAINRELTSSRNIQLEKSDTIIKELLRQQKAISANINDSADYVRQEIKQLNATIQKKLQVRGKNSGRKITSQVENTKEIARNANNKVAESIRLNTEKARFHFDTVIKDSQTVIEANLNQATRQTIFFSISIILICTGIAMVLGMALLRAITEPITKVLGFAEEMSKGNLTGRLPEGKDEMGQMGGALNTMADEIFKLREAQLNSFNQTLDQLLDCVFMFDPDNLQYTYVNRRAREHTGFSSEEMMGMTTVQIKPEYTHQSFKKMISPLIDGSIKHLTYLSEHRNKTGEQIPVEILVQYVVPPDQKGKFVEIVRDISERKKAEQDKEKLQARLLFAQKMESVGQLAAGLAHEINTPAQYLGSNIDFLDEAYQDIAEFMLSIQSIVQDKPLNQAAKIVAALELADWEYLAEEIPSAIDQSRDGVKRVAAIVLAMKKFSHPASTELAPVDINSVIETTLTVTQNEWKEISEITTDYSDNLPPVPCLEHEMGQVLLNIIMNATHAIREVLTIQPSDQKGKIHISTALENDRIEIKIGDSGPGIPEKIRARIFDPFFTTKDVGSGIGQGLTICHDVITEKHGGTLTFNTEIGKGTVFIITLPLNSSDTQLSAKKKD